MKLNKSGISATSGILNYSNYNSNGTNTITSNYDKFVRTDTDEAEQIQSG